MYILCYTSIHETLYNLLNNVEFTNKLYSYGVNQFFNIVAMWLRALPALNHSICMAFIECWSVNSSVLPSVCFRMHFTG